MTKFTGTSLKNSKVKDLILAVPCPTQNCISKIQFYDSAYEDGFAEALRISADLAQKREAELTSRLYASYAVLAKAKLQLAQ